MYLGKKALSTGMSIGGDILQGENLKESAKKRLKSAGKEVLIDGAERVKKFAQTGSGKKRRRRTRKRKIIKPKIKRKNKKKAITKKKTKRKPSVKIKKSKKKQLSFLFK
jgi:hypothetical protein